MHDLADYARVVLMIGVIAVIVAAYFVGGTAGIFLLIAGMLVAWGAFRAMNRFVGGSLLGDEDADEGPSWDAP